MFAWLGGRNNSSRESRNPKQHEAQAVEAAAAAARAAAAVAAAIAASTNIEVCLSDDNCDPSLSDSEWVIITVSPLPAGTIVFGPNASGEQPEFATIHDEDSDLLRASPSPTPSVMLLDSIEVLPPTFQPAASLRHPLVIRNNEHQNHNRNHQQQQQNKQKHGQNQQRASRRSNAQSVPPRESRLPRIQATEMLSKRHVHVASLRPIQDENFIPHPTVLDMLRSRGLRHELALDNEHASYAFAKRAQAASVLRGRTFHYSRSAIFRIR